MDGTKQKASDALFGSPEGRYPKPAGKVVKLRAPELSPHSGVPFAAYIHSSSPDSGAYSGFSFAIFPVVDRPSLVAMIAGTQGLSPDEAILGRPGHTPKMATQELTRAGVFVALCISLGGSIWPAIRALRIDPIARYTG